MQNSQSIVVLDGYTLNPGDLSWAPLEKLGSTKVYDRTPKADILTRASHATIVLTNKTPLDKETINALPNLKYIGVLATGYNVVDIQAAKEKNIPVCNVPGYSGMSVAQAVFALLLEITNRTALHANAVQNGQWSNCPDFCFTLSPLIELNNLTLGLIGYGNIAQSTIQIAQALGMKILVHTRTVPNPAPKNINFVSRDELFKNSDVITLHCPLTDQTKNIINKSTLSLMKPTAILINTGRGPLINEADLAEALNNNKIYAAGLDVLSEEPPKPSNPLLKAKNCFITPHNAWASLAARTRLLKIAVENIEDYLNAKIKNRVNQ